MTPQDVAMKVAALDSAQWAVGEASAQLETARARAAGICDRAWWVSPAGTAFRAAMAGWQERVQASREGLAVLGDEIAAARAVLLGQPTVPVEVAWFG